MLSASLNKTFLSLSFACLIRAYREHVRRKAAIEQRGFDPDLVAWSRDYKSLRDDHELERKEKLDDVAQK